MRIQIPRWISIALTCLILPGFYNELKTSYYFVDTGTFSQPVRLAFVSDLHDCAWGEEMAGLIAAVDRQKPDLVLMGGDLFSDGPSSENTVRFLKEIGGRYPCYYVTGNHEYAGSAEAFAHRMAVLEEWGVVRLGGTMAKIEVNGGCLNLCGVDDPAAAGFSAFEDQLKAVSALPRDGGCTVLMAHRPEWFDLYCEYGYDLVLAGHAHGGQASVPGLVNGLYASGQGLFPQYAGGKYEKNGAVMIVGRGLIRESARLPRFYNPPELVIIDLK